MLTDGAAIGIYVALINSNTAGSLNSQMPSNDGEAVGIRRLFDVANLHVFILYSAVMADRVKCSKICAYFTKLNENAAKCK